MIVAAALRRRLPSNATDRAFRSLVAGAESNVRVLVNALVAGKLSPAEWQDAMLETLAHAHAEAGYRGRLRAGDTTPFDADDTRFGQLVAHEEQPYLWRFRQDIEAGRYGTEELIPGVDQEAINRRALMYTSRLYGTANEALALVAGDDEEWVWSLGPTDHCVDCLRLQENSPYRGKPPTMPRQGHTRCLSSCGCSCTSSSGLETFAP